MQLDIEDLKIVRSSLDMQYTPTKESEYLKELLTYLIDREKFERAYIDIKRLNSFTTLKLDK